MFSNYNGRRAPNVSQYLNNLNAIPSAQDAQADLNLGDDGLDFLTNTEFVDFDASFNNTNAFNAAGQDLPQQRGDAPYGFPDYNAYQPTATGVSSPSDIQSPATAGLAGQYPSADHFASLPNTGDKRKASAAALPVTASDGGDLEDVSRAAAEEDKRRRNTAASARFRVKKKQREQALEKQAKEMTDKVTLLEGKVQALERENKWLKELITEKNDPKPAGNGKGLVDRKAAAEVERSTESRTDGVGTGVADGKEAVVASEA